MRNSEFQPGQVSQAFVDFIKKERVHVTKKQTFPATSVFLAHDWCVDRHHNYRGDKPIGLGVIVAGASVRRQSYNDCGILTPYEFMQQVAQSETATRPGNYRFYPATVHFAAHRHCGELFVTHGAVTLKEQLKIIDSAWRDWQNAYKRLNRNSSADVKRVHLGIKEDIDVTGSAPTIKIDRRGNVEIDNMFYLGQHAVQFPLNPEFIQRLPESQRVYFKQ